MKKKIAFRGFLVLIIAAALCLFFSGTLKTMFMPNVQLVTIKSGKLRLFIVIRKTLHKAFPTR